MIFANVAYTGRYEEKHDELLALLKRRFESVRAGLQSDSWIWVQIGDEKVAIDTFTSTTHQVKSARPGTHVEQVIAVLREKYELMIYPEPELEAHE